MSWNLPFAFMLAIFSVRQTKDKDTLSWAGSVVQVREKALHSLHLPGLDTAVCQKTKGKSFQGYNQTGAAGEEITQRQSEKLLIIHLSLYLSEEVAERIPNCS